MIPQKLIEWLATTIMVNTNCERPTAEVLANLFALRIVRAIEEGDLELTKIPPKLPGEVERKGFVIWARLADWAFEMFTARNAVEFIAFRPEEKDDPTP